MNDEEIVSNARIGLRTLGISTGTAIIGAFAQDFGFTHVGGCLEFFAFVGFMFGGMLFWSAVRMRMQEDSNDE